MKKLSKEHRARLDEIRKAYEIALGDLQHGINTYNQVMADIGAFRDEVIEAIEAYTSERSEAWQESEKAAQYENWVSSWQDIDNEELMEPDDLMLGDLPIEPEAL